MNKGTQVWVRNSQKGTFKELMVLRSRTAKSRVPILYPGIQCECCFLWGRLALKERVRFSPKMRKPSTDRQMEGIGGEMEDGGQIFQNG